MCTYIYPLCLKKQIIIPHTILTKTLNIYILLYIPYGSFGNVVCY